MVSELHMEIYILIVRDIFQDVRYRSEVSGKILVLGNSLDRNLDSGKIELGRQLDRGLKASREFQSWREMHMRIQVPGIAPEREFLRRIKKILT